MKKIKNRKGLTLAEVIVAGIILAMLLLGFVSFQWVAARSQQHGVAELLLQQNHSRLGTILKKVVH
ncbi:MAG: prepilin-type N-terminal cleavage/methylation domain-containing protein, partial [bacterium]